MAGNTASLNVPTDEPQSKDHGGRVSPSTQLPSKDFPLNALLVNIAKKLDQSELDTLKFLCSGIEGIGAGVLEKITTSLELFKILKQMRLLDRENLLQLQGMIWHLGRKDLHKDIVTFAQSRGALHFFAPIDTPENGYKYVKFHVDGNLNSITRLKIAAIKALMVELLCIPGEFVIFSGLEPSNSLLITFMIPEEFFSSMPDVARNHVAELKDMGINRIIIGEETVLCDEDASTRAKDECQETKEMERLLTRDRNLTTQVDNVSSSLLDTIKSRNDLLLRIKSHNEVIEQLKIQLEVTKSNANFTLGLFVTAVYNLHQLEKTGNGRKSSNGHRNFCIDSLKVKSALTYFNAGMKKARKLGYDEMLLWELLDARAVVGYLNVADHNELRALRTDLQLRFQWMQTQQIITHNALGMRPGTTVQVVQQLSIPTPQSMLTRQPVSIGQDILQQMPQIQIVPGFVAISSQFADFLKDLSLFLKPKERQAIQKQFIWTAEESKRLTDSPELLLESVVKISAKVGVQNSEIVGYIKRLLESVHRSDLVDELIVTNEVFFNKSYLTLLNDITSKLTREEYNHVKKAEKTLKPFSEIESRILEKSPHRAMEFILRRRLALGHPLDQLQPELFQTLVSVRREDLIGDLLSTRPSVSIPKERQQFVHAGVYKESQHSTQHPTPPESASPASEKPTALTQDMLLDRMNRMENMLTKLVSQVQNPMSLWNTPTFNDHAYTQLLNQIGRPDMCFPSKLKLDPATSS